MLSTRAENKIGKRRHDEGRRAAEKSERVGKKTSTGGRRDATGKAADKKMNVGDYLRKLRKQRGLSLRQVVLLSDGMLDKTTISRIEKNTRLPSLRAVFAFSRIYKVRMEPVAELALGGKNILPALQFATSANEKEMIEKFRRMTKNNKLLVKGLVETLSSDSKEPGIRHETAPGQEKKSTRRAMSGGHGPDGLIMSMSPDGDNDEKMNL